VELEKIVLGLGVELEKIVVGLGDPAFNKSSLIIVNYKVVYLNINLKLVSLNIYQTGHGKPSHTFTPMY